MNARQKAKKYKKLAEINKAKADAYDRYMRAEAFKNQTTINGTIETLKIVQFWDDRISDILIKKEIANEIGKFCLDNNLIYLEFDKNYDAFTMCRKVTGTMKVCKDWKEANANEDSD